MVGAKARLYSRNPAVGSVRPDTRHYRRERHAEDDATLLSVKLCPVYGDYAGSSPARAIVDALDTGAIDVAIVWGPTAGYFALHDNIRLDLRPITPHVDLPMLPMVFDITMGVRRDNDKLRDEVNAALAKHRLEIDAILTAYGVPRVDSKGSTP
jgi:mxaJ protein